MSNRLPTPRAAFTLSETAVSRTVGHNVRRLREVHGWTLETLAQKLSATERPISSSTLRVVERGTHPAGSRRSVSVDELVALASALGVEPSRLLEQPNCETCLGAAPSGFTCNTCGATGR